LHAQMCGIQKKCKMGLYERQETLNLITDINITIAGCGGIGYWVAKFAAMSGIKEMFLFDPDILEEHNLNRIDLPEKFLGRNKADVTALVIKTLRPDCIVHARPFILQEFNYTKTDWIVDCTDKYDSQIQNQYIANTKLSRYVKAGYNGEHFSINDKVAEWGEAEDGYTIVPSWVVPATIVAGLTVAKIMKYQHSEVSKEIVDVFRKES